MILFYTKYVSKHLRILLLSSVGIDLSRPFNNDERSIFYVLIKCVIEDLIVLFKQTENYERKSVAICVKRGPKHRIPTAASSMKLWRTTNFLSLVPRLSRDIPVDF